MRKSEHKKRNQRFGLGGLLWEGAVLLCLLPAAAMLIQNNMIGERELRILLPAGCLLAGIVGACTASGNNGSRTLALLLSGVVPPGLLLCAGAAVSLHEKASGILYWNAALLLMPSLLALLLGGRRRSRKSR